MSTPPTTGPDVRQVVGQPLTEQPFPGGRAADFRVAFDPSAHRAVWDHAREDTSVEICGVLVGRWARDAAGPYVHVTDSIRGEAARAKFAEVTFTHETWNKINAEMDAKFADRAIVGWYHTHPDFGIFLSDRDRFIHEHFFSGPGQVAHVVDPIRLTEGVFTWSAGKPALRPHFWVGNDLHLGTAAGEEPNRALAATPGTQPASAALPYRTAEPEGWLGLATQLLAFLCLFLLGYVLAGQRSSWEREQIEAGAVAHYGLWKGVRPGLEENLRRTFADLEDVTRQVVELNADHLKRLDPKDAAQAALKERWQIVGLRLTGALRRLAEMETRYGLTPAEREEVDRLYDLEMRRKLADTGSTAGGASAPATKGAAPPGVKPAAATKGATAPPAVPAATSPATAPTTPDRSREPR